MVSMSDDCVQKNCDKTGLSGAECIQVINDCANTSKFGYNASQIGNCANAMRSCYENQIDTSPCKDNGVLARAASCNNGNVNADGTTCGMDTAIDNRNAEAGGDDFKTNRGIKGDRENAAKEVCRQNAAWTIPQIEQCEKNAVEDLNACYSENGGTASQFTDDEYENCLITKADNPGDCEARGGTWDPATKKCTDPTPPGDPNDPNNPDNDTPTAGVGGTAPDVKGQCGKARTNLIDCGEEGGVTAFNNVLRIAIIALTFLVGVAAVGGLAYASIQYANAQDDSGKVSSAKTLITNIVIGIMLYGFMLAILMWLVPGLSFT